MANDLDTSLLQQNMSDVNKGTANSVDKMFETFRTLKESKDKAMKAQLEHQDNIATINAKSMTDPSANIYIDPKSGQPTELPDTLKVAKQAGLKAGTEYEANKAAMTLDVLRRAYSNQPQTDANGEQIPAPQFVTSMAGGKVSVRQVPPETKFQSQRIEQMVANRDQRETFKQDSLGQAYTKQLQQAVNGNGAIAIQNKSVNNAVHARQILDQSYDPKTGEFNVPPSMHTELAMSLARLISQNGQVSENLTNQLQQGTMKQKMASLAIYLGADPKKTGGPTQSVVKVFRDAVDRQGLTSEKLRDSQLDQFKNMFPARLNKDDKDRLTKQTIGTSYSDYLKTAPDKIAEKSFNSPAEADKAGLPSGSVVMVKGRRYQI